MVAKNLDRYLRLFPILAGVILLGLLWQCASPLTLQNTTKAFVEDGLSQLFVAKSSFIEAGASKTTVPSNTAITVQLALVNPKNLDATYTLSWNLPNADFTVLPTSPVAVSTTSLSFGFTLATAAEHQDVVFTLGIFVGSTGKTYPSQTFQVRCDSPPSPAGNLIIGQDSNTRYYIEFTKPTAATDDDLTSAIITYQDVNNPAAPGPATTVTLGLSSLTTVPATGTDLLSSLTTATKYYFAPLVTQGHAYAFQVTLVDAAGQKSSASTVGASGISYTLSYDANLGSGTIASTNWAWGDSANVASAAPLTRSGYVVTHWNTHADGSGVSVVSDGTGTLVMNAGNITLYAQWAPVYSVTYHANTAIGSLPTDPALYQAGASFIVSGPGGLTKSGYSFDHWDTNPLGGGTTYLPGVATMPGNNLALYAIWTVINYTVTYDGTGPYTGSVPATPTVYAANATVTVLGSGTLTGSNLLFEGWSTGPSGTGTSYTQGDTFVLTGNVTLYPMWFTVSGTTITAIQGNPTIVVLPPSVTDIGTAFRGCTTLTSISMPGVTSLAANAFDSCTSLTSVSMPAVTSIGASAFYFCTALPTLNFPSTLLSVASQAFGDCFALASITGGSVTCPVVNGALMSGTTLMFVPPKLSGAFTFPSTTTAIDSDAFSSCSLLTSISGFPAGLTTIGYRAFVQLNCAISIVLPSTVTTISPYAFLYSDITSITIPSTVLSIGDEAFYANTSLTSVTIGSSVLSIGDSAFSGCSSLTGIVMQPLTPPALTGSNNFPTTVPIHVAGGSYAAYVAAYPGYNVVTP